MPISRNVFLNPPDRPLLDCLLGFLLPLTLAFRLRVLAVRLRRGFGFTLPDSGLAVLSIAEFFRSEYFCTIRDSASSRSRAACCQLLA